MSKQFKVFVLLVAAFSGEFLAYRLGKNAAIREIQDRPGMCVAGQLIRTTSGLYICAESRTWTPMTDAQYMQLFHK
jgi:hypothetical protein